MGATEVKADEYRDAVRTMGKAYYKYSGMDYTVKRIEKRYVPEYFRKNTAYTIIIGLVITKEIRLKWTFK